MFCMCRSSYYRSIFLQVADANMKILAIDPRRPGSSHDSFGWRHSTLRRRISEQGLLRPGEFLLGESFYMIKATTDIELSFFTCRGQWLSAGAMAHDTSGRASHPSNTRRAVQHCPFFDEDSCGALHWGAEKQVSVPPEVPNSALQPQACCCHYSSMCGAPQPVPRGGWHC